jgi:tetratricopeptide (TPR) repeat protein
MIMARGYAFLCRLLPAFLLCGLLLSSPSSASNTEPVWIRVSSTHFSVLTNAGEKKGRLVALRFEQMRSVFSLLLMKTRLNLPEPLEIIALKSDKEYAQIAPIHKGQPISAPGFFVPGEDRNFIVLNLFEDDSWRAVTHEFAHLLLNYNYPATPGWFDEGFAEYFSSIHLDNKFVQLGADPELKSSWNEDLFGDQTEVRNPPKSLTELLSGPVWLPWPDLFTMRHDTSGYKEGTHHTLFYAQSWIMVHYLINKNKLSETGTYFDLVENQKLPVEQAIQQAYGLSAGQFDQAVKDYFHSLTTLQQALDNAKESAATDPGGQTHQLAAPVGPDDVGASVQNVSDTDGPALVAEAAVRLPERREQALKTLEGIANQPKVQSVIAHRAMAWAHMDKKEFDAATEELGKAMEADNRDPWARYELALVKYHAAQASGQQFQGLSNMMQDLRAVLDVYPEFAEAYAMLAMARVEGGGINSALESIRAAIALSPRNERYLVILAQIYIADKKWDAAQALLDRLKASQNPQISSTARKYLEDLPTLKKYGLMPQQKTEAGQATAPAPSPARPSAALEPKKDEAPGQDNPPPAEPQPDTRAVHFLKGKLVSVDCTQAPAALLTISTGKQTMKLRTADYKALLLIGADEFSCKWSNRLVAINYKAGGKADGDLVSLEVQ